MNEIIGYWLIIFAIVFFIIFIETDLTVKDKIIMVFITVFLAGVCLVVGG